MWRVYEDRGGLFDYGMLERGQPSSLTSRSMAFWSSMPFRHFDTSALGESLNTGEKEEEKKMSRQKGKECNDKQKTETY